MRTRTLADLAQIYLHLGGDPLSFKDHRFMIDILNYQGKQKFLLCSRQVGKSVILSTELLMSVAAFHKKKERRMTYVSPSGLQSSQFSIEKLKPMIMNSPRFKAAYYDSRLHNDVGLKEFKNGIQIYLRSAFRDADRIRGIPNDKLFVDEVQDVSWSLFPDMESSMDASPIQQLTMSGTPKSLLNTANQFWKVSTQTEWMVPCTHHSPMYWNKLDTDNIGLTGPICDRCGNRIYPEFGQWVDGLPGAKLKGFHVSQLGVSWKQNEKKWKDEIVFKRDNWPVDKFNNETLGIAWGQANKPIPQKTMIKCCYPNSKAMLYDNKTFLDLPPTKGRAGTIRWFAGIDWGEGRDKASFEKGKLRAASYTILTIGGYAGGGKFVIAHWKKFTGHEIKTGFIIKYLIDILRKWNVELIGMDYGHGWGMHDRMIDAFTLERCALFYESANLKCLYKWSDDADMYVLNRNAMMSRIIRAVHDQVFAFPEWHESQEMSADFEAIFKEYSMKSGTMRYDHDPSEPDDSFHSAMFCKMAADMAHGFISDGMNI